jgi:hypothetical protein
VYYICLNSISLREGSRFDYVVKHLHVKVGEVVAMLNNDFLKTIEANECCCSQVVPDGNGATDECSKRSVVFTPREQSVLSRIREASERARILKRKINDFETRGADDLEAHARAVSELEELRRMRADLEMERVAAAEERMRLLGHV